MKRNKYLRYKYKKKGGVCLPPFKLTLGWTEDNFKLYIKAPLYGIK